MLCGSRTGNLAENSAQISKVPVCRSCAPTTNQILCQAHGAGDSGRLSSQGINTVGDYSHRQHAKG